jgi:hypothetical protein
MGEHCDHTVYDATPILDSDDVSLFSVSLYAPEQRRKKLPPQESPIQRLARFSCTSLIAQLSTPLVDRIQQALRQRRERLGATHHASGLGIHARPRPRFVIGIAIELPLRHMQKVKRLVLNLAAVTHCLGFLRTRSGDYISCRWDPAPAVSDLAEDIERTISAQLAHAAAQNDIVAQELLVM